MYNVGQARGLTFWAPNINVLRDPRWGGRQETPGEDPLVVGDYSVSYVRGIQGDTFEGGKLDPNGANLQVSACCKHFIANDLDNWKTADRYNFDANISQQDLADTYLPPFHKCVQQGQASGIMCAYNRVNDLPNCADYNLLTKLARQDWGFKGYIASDCDAVAIMHDVQGYSKLPEDAVASVLKAGMDVNCGSYLKKYTKSAVEMKKITEADIDRALENLFTIRMRLGLFNGNPKKGMYGNLGPKEVCSKEHQELALEAARNGIVLLKNSLNHLPLSKDKTTSLAVIGPNAQTTETLLGNYEGVACKNVTVFEALRKYVKNTKYHQGCVDYVNCTSIAIDEAVGIAKAADFVILVMGLDQSQEREKHDRIELVLPGKQEDLVLAVARAAKKPVLLVLICGGPVDVSFAKDDAKIGSILWAGYPGEAGGTALAEIIFGDHNPGRLPMTWYPKEFSNVPMTDMRMRPDPSSGYPGRTYRFYNGKTVFEFGYGLSYSKHSYKFVSGNQSKIILNPNIASPSPYVLASGVGIERCEKVEFTVVIGVENQGQAGNHTVLLFAKGKGEDINGPMVKQLVGFKRSEAFQDTDGQKQANGDKDSLTCVSDSSSSKPQSRSTERQHLESSRTKRPLIFLNKDDQNSVTKVKSCSVLKMDTAIRKPVRKKSFSNDKSTCKDPITGWTCRENRSSIESRKQSIDDAAGQKIVRHLLTDDDWFQEMDKLADAITKLLDSSSSKPQRRSNERQHLESSRTKRPLIFLKDDHNSVTKVKSCSVLKMDTDIRKPDRKKSFSNDKPTCKDPITEWTCRDSLTCVSDTSSSKPQRRSTERQHPESSRTKRPLIFSRKDDQNSVTKVKSCSVLKMDTAIRKPVRKEGFTNDKPACNDPITEWTCRENRSSVESRKQSIDDAAGQKIVRHLLTDDDLFQEMDKLADEITKLLGNIPDGTEIY